MAKADHIKKLIASFGRNQEFRAAALRIIDDAANQGKRPFAESLRKILDANVRPDYQAVPQPGLTTLRAFQRAWFCDRGDQLASIFGRGCVAAIR